MTYTIERELTPDVTLVIPLDNQNLNNITDNDDFITTEHVQFRTKINGFEIKTINKARQETQANTTVKALITTVTNLMSLFDPSAQYWFKQDADEPLYHLHKQIFSNTTDLCKAETKWQKNP